MLLKSNFSSFPHYFVYIFLISGVKLHIHLLNAFVQFIVFLTLSTLICRGTDISKYFSESLGIRDNESQPNFMLMPLYYKYFSYACYEMSGMSATPMTDFTQICKRNGTNRADNERLRRFEQFKCLTALTQKNKFGLKCHYFTGEKR